jgi:uncharacterized membrane protein (DUF2068 family)
MEQDLENKQGTLRLIILYKFLAGILHLTLAIGMLGLLNKESEETLLSFITSFNINLNMSYIEGLIKDAYLLSNKVILAAFAVFFFFSLLAFLESYGLHIRQRWGEWLTVISTATFIPYEVYEIIVRISPGRIVLLIVNCLIVYYLAKHKELFKGKNEA